MSSSSALRVVTVIGARPQFIKAAALSKAIAARDDVRECIVHTGQHYDSNMSEVFFEELGVPKPVANLAVGSGTHAAQTANIMSGLDAAFDTLAPDVVLVYGDTNSTLAAALVAAKRHIRVAHVEAGLRSHNRRMPEEVNRVLTDHVSDWAFCPTQVAVDNLMREGLSADSVHLVGDVMFDLAVSLGDQHERWALLSHRLSLASDDFVLATVHRAENTDDGQRLSAIFGALAEVARTHPVVIPLHPRTRRALERSGDLSRVSSVVQFTEPLGFFDMACLQRHAALVVTDSGGVQKEAFFHETPCVTVRDETEWVELVDAGWNRVVSPIAAAPIVEAIRAAVGTTGQRVRPYGDGTASERIAALLTV